MAVHTETKAPEVSVLCFLKDFFFFFGGGGWRGKGGPRSDNLKGFLPLNCVPYILCRSKVIFNSASRSNWVNDKQRYLASCSLFLLCFMP